MANSYKFLGVNLSTQTKTSILTAAAKDTIIIKSIRVTNNTDDLINYLSVTDREASKALNKKIKENEEWLTSNA